MDLNVLNRPLEVSETPGLETTDSRLDDVATRSQDGDYAGAAAAAQSVLEEGVYDVRLLGFFFYGVILEQGITALLPVIQTLNGVLRDNWAAFGPTARKEKQTQAAMRWFLNQLLKKLQFEENAKGGLWEEWISAVTIEDVQEILEAIDEVKRSLGMALEDASGPLIDGWGKIGQWLRSFQQYLHSAEAEPEPEPEPEPEEAEPEPVEEEEEAEEAPAASTRMSSAGAVQFQGDPTGASVEGSYHLQVLMRKLAAFTRLIEEEKYSRAALVADDINGIINNFDPRVYFPKLFASYLSLLVLNIEELTAYDESKESPEWQALREYYKVDLDGFMNL